MSNTGNELINGTGNDKTRERRLAEHEANLLTVKYVAPPSGIMEALDGWAVIVRDKDGVEIDGVFKPFTPQDGTEGMFSLCDVLEPDKVLYRTHIDNVAEIVVL